MQPSALPALTPLQRIPLVLKTLLLALFVGAAAWVAVERVLGHNLQQALENGLEAELERLATRNRREFNRLLEDHQRAARLLVAQAGFHEEAARLASKPGDAVPVRHRHPPPWLPPPSVLRSFYRARFALLLDAAGQAREIYASVPAHLPDRLLKPGILLRKLSHNPVYLTELDGIPYILAERAWPDERHPSARLLLASPIDRELLRGIAGDSGPGTVLALLGGEPHQVLTSSDPQRVPPGAMAAALTDDYLITGKAFLDQGASDLRVQFATLLARDRADATMEPLLAVERRTRAGLLLALLVPFLAVVFVVGWRLRRVTREVATLSRASLGLASVPTDGDELTRLLSLFRDVNVELTQVREALERETWQKIEANRAAMEAEQKAHQLEHLRAVTDALGVGVVTLDHAGAHAANAVMEGFAARCGGLSRFLRQQDGELHLRDHDGAECVYRVRRPTLGEAETLLVQDISEQVQAERERRVFALLPRESPNPILRIGSSGVLQYANGASKALLEHWRCEVGELLPPAICVPVKEALETGLDRTIELEVGTRWYSFVVAYVEQPDFLYLFGADITARKRAEQALTASERRFRGVLESAPDAILLIDGSGRIAYVNGRGEEVLGFPPGALPGAPLARLLPSADGIGTGDMAKVLGRGDGVLHARRRDGSDYPVEIRLATLPGEETLIATLRDVTEREQAARDIRQLNRLLEEHVRQLTEANFELESFSYSVSHDLRAPLRSINGFGRILQDEYAATLGEEGRGYLDRIAAASNRMAALIDGLLSLAHLSRTEVLGREVDLAALARDIIADLRRQEPQREVVVDIPPSLPAWGDPALLRTALENLLANAWKFTAQCSSAHITVGSEQRDGRRWFFVRDNGAGFDMSYAGKLFKPFERLHVPSEFPGTGIGLATVARIVRKHGGTIDAEGEPGTGATFRFNLGAAPTEPGARERAAG